MISDGIEGYHLHRGIYELFSLGQVIYFEWNFWWHGLVISAPFSLPPFNDKFC